ncbi:MAG: 16S rRNA methyltransferase [Desulfurococcales archaeon]|nr:16S rRNA methyltransferase [Desulfurococcales archaeon]
MPGKYGFIVLEGSLELIPEVLYDHPSVISTSNRRRKDPSSIILDKSLHYKAMKKANLPQIEKRGRPDIVHYLLLSILESPLNKLGYISSLYLHTINGEILRIEPTTRLPKNYNRFIGLMEQVLENGKVPPNSSQPLIMKIGGSLEDIVGKYHRFLVFEYGCNRIDEKCGRELSKNGILLGIGGFPHGRISNDILKLANNCYSLLNISVDAVSALHMILCLAENKTIGLYCLQ